MKLVNRWVVAVFSVAAANAAFSADYYVAKSGNDSNPGTKDRPWATISKANGALQPGDTVYIRGGEYTQVLRPSRSGKPGEYITYRAFPGEMPVITNVSANNRTAIVLDGRRYIRIDGLKVTGKKSGKSANLKSWISMNNAHHNVVQNSEFRFAQGWFAVVLDKGSSHNRFLNNTMVDVGSWSGGNGDMVGVKCASHNLFQGNYFSKGGHNLLDVAGSYNVVRANVFDNKWGNKKGYRSVDLSGNYKFCTAGPNGYNLFEHNIIRNTEISRKGDKPVAMKVQGTGQIVRFNLYLNNVGPAISTAVRDSYNIRQSWKNRIYNNAFVNNHSLWEARDYGNTRPIHSNIFKNNAIHGVKSSTVIWGNLQAGGRAAGYDAMANSQFIANSFGDGGRSMTANFMGIGNRALSWYESNKSRNFRNSVFEDPGFVTNRPHKIDDLKLTDASPLIDKGQHLTLTGSEGSGTSVKVADAGYFSDGFKVVEGDHVQIGANAPVQIVKVDYSKNVLTLAQPISWGKGAPVSLPYHGSAPDIGVAEFEAGLVPPAAPKNLMLEVVAE